MTDLGKTDSTYAQTESTESTGCHSETTDSADCLRATFFGVTVPRKNPVAQ